MKHLFFISFVAACLLASCNRPQLVFLNGEPIEGTPQEFIERSNYCGVDSANNPIYFPPYDSTGIENVIIVSGIPTDEDVVPFGVYFDIIDLEDRQERIFYGFLKFIKIV